MLLGWPQLLQKLLVKIVGINLWSSQFKVWFIQCIRQSWQREVAYHLCITGYHCVSSTPQSLYGMYPYHCTAKTSAWKYLISTHIRNGAVSHDGIISCTHHESINESSDIWLFPSTPIATIVLPPFSCLLQINLHSLGSSYSHPGSYGLQLGPTV